MCGESHLNDTLRKPVHEALRQCITVHYNYAGLSDDEVSKYILHKIQLAGASSTIIDIAALAAVHSFTQENPRLIDNLMTDTLTIGSQQDRKVIDAGIIRAAVIPLIICVSYRYGAIGEVFQQKSKCSSHLP